jgi:hypothetical protein
MSRPKALRALETAAAKHDYADALVELRAVPDGRRVQVDYQDGDERCKPHLTQSEIISRVLTDGRNCFAISARHEPTMSQ